ncbi:hypothetical protein B0I21_11064 [Sphingobacterium paludis]|uniref:Uncharacterized protein n=1 Tax=Sphingobacterium paludis TaxID=1476465 RepID=A0A4R7CRM0_9SPHI|nr:hypothetical protein B0I21_11064 [Sphingobacterium paludis]
MGRKVDYPALLQTVKKMLKIGGLMFFLPVNSQF